MLAEVAREPDGPDEGMVSCEVTDDDVGRVRAGVVHEDHLARRGSGAAGRELLLDERCELLDQRPAASVSPR